jgi:hypothetical protein
MINRITIIYDIISPIQKGGTGKTTFARKMAHLFTNPVFISAYDIGCFNKSFYINKLITDNIDFLVIDDIKYEDLLKYVLLFSQPNLEQELMGGRTIKIVTPPVVLITSIEKKQEIEFTANYADQLNLIRLEKTAGLFDFVKVLSEYKGV